MNTPDWISRKVSQLLPTTGLKENKPPAPEFIAPGAIKSDPSADAVPDVFKPVVPRSTRARLASTLSRQDEALSPREMRRALAEVQHRRATVSPRQRLLQRFSAFPEGIRFLVDLRADMLPQLKSDKRLQALDVEMKYMFSTWFDVGFLDLRRISWDSPASLIEKKTHPRAIDDLKF